MKASSSVGTSKPQRRGVVDKAKKKEQPVNNDIQDKSHENDSDQENSDSENPAHYASIELRKILHFNEGIDKMNELAAQLHQEFIDASTMRPGAATAFYDQLASLENAHKYPTYLSHTPDSMFETKHIKFDTPALNPATAGGVCRDPSPEEYAKFLENSEGAMTNLTTSSGPSSSSVGKREESAMTIKKSGKFRGQNSEDEIQSVMHAPEIWKLAPDNSFVARQNLKDSMVSDAGEKQSTSTRRIVNNYYPAKNAFVNPTKAQTFWVHLGIPMPSPPSPFLTSTFLKLNNPHPQPSGLVTLDNGVRRFCVAMNGFSSDELTFKIEGKRVAVMGCKPKDKKNPNGQKRTAQDGFTLPDDLNLNDLQVHRDDAGNVIFEEIWHEPDDDEERMTVLDEDT